MKHDVNATHYENIPTFPPDAAKNARLVHAVIETPQGSTHKNALKSEFGIIALRSVLSEGLRWPYDYGFIPRTLADDGDPLDILFLIDAPTFAGCLVEARVLGAVKLKKGGVENDRIVGAPLPTTGTAQTADAYKEMSDLPREKLDSIKRFLIEYSSEQGNVIEFVGIVSADEAMKSVRDAMKKYKKKF